MTMTTENNYTTKNPIWLQLNSIFLTLSTAENVEDIIHVAILHIPVELSN